jgi:hypothetical protein
MRRLTTPAACLMSLVALMAIHCSHKPKFEPAKNDILGRLQEKKQKLNRKGVLAEVAIAESRDLQTAINKAELEARAKLGRSIESKASSLQKKFQEEVGREYSDHFSQTVKSVSDQVLQGATLAETPFEQDGEGRYRVYGLLVLDAETYGKALAGQLEADKAMRDRWRASRAYKELNDEIAAFQQWKRAEAVPAAPAAPGAAAAQGL